MDFTFTKTVHVDIENLINTLYDATYDYISDREGSDNVTRALVHDIMNAVAVAIIATEEER